MAISSYKTYLMSSTDGTAYTKLIDIKSFPDLGGAPEMLETTTLSDGAKTYIPGIQSMDAMTFNTNYTLADYKKLKDLEGKDMFFSVWFGDEGVNGKFNFKGALSVFAAGGEVNAVVDMTVTIAPSTVITLAA